MLARGFAAFERAHQLGPIALPGAIYVASPPGPTYAPSRGRSDATALRDVVLQRGDDGGAYLFGQRVVKPSEQVLLLALAAIQDCTDDEAAKPEARGYLGADSILACIMNNLNAASELPLPSRREVTTTKLYNWLMRLRECINQANILGATGDEVIESGGKKGIRLGPRFRIAGFKILDEARRYKESTTRNEGGSKR